MDLCKLPEGYVPSEDEEYMNPKQLEFFKQKLLKWKQDLVDGRDVLEYLKEETNPGTDFGDRAAVENDMRCELRTKNRQAKLISKIDAALLRIQNGTYGYCEMTGAPIGVKRLMARPIATLSIEAQEQHEQEEKQGSN